MPRTLINRLKQESLTWIKADFPGHDQPESQTSVIALNWVCDRCQVSTGYRWRWAAIRFTVVNPWSWWISSPMNNVSHCLVSKRLAVGVVSWLTWSVRHEACADCTGRVPASAWPSSAGSDGTDWLESLPSHYYSYSPSLYALRSTLTHTNDGYRCLKAVISDVRVPLVGYFSSLTRQAVVNADYDTL